MTVNNVRIIARLRPLLKGESEKDVVVSAEEDAISMPNPKNENENFTFPFNAVHGRDSDQAQLFSEVSPTLKHLFKGNDVTIFAYGATGSGKTYTMRGQKAASERGIIPRFLTAVYRRGKELERKTGGATTTRAIMTYYEIYNDRVFDLFQPPEKRTPAGLPLRESNGKTQVVGLIDKEITSLKEFEALYDKANANRSTSATRLNAHSSRSHAVICVKVVIEDKNAGESKTGTVSCIDLAGSEDNRRTCNDKERMTESASINKSLFVLAQCVEAMTKKQNRIPYRESKMTRILSLGQNNGLTVMILNLAPTRAFHLDTLSSLNFANRTKKIELKQAENDHPQVSFPSRHDQLPPMLSQHGPTRAFGTTKTNTTHVSNPQKGSQKDKAPKPPNRAPLAPQSLRQTSGVKKPMRSYDKHHQLSPTNIADIVEKKVEEILAARALNEPSKKTAADVSDEVNKRLELLEKKLEKKADAKAEGLTYILLAKQHAARGENFSALKMYELAVPYFPENNKLLKKISDLKDKDKNTTIKTTMPNSSDLVSSLDATNGKSSSYSSVRQVFVTEETFAQAPAPVPRPKPKRTFAVFSDIGNDAQRQPVPRSLPAAAEMEEDTASEYEDDGNEEAEWSPNTQQTPRTKNLLRIINSEDVSQIMKLKGVGKKRAEALAQAVRERRQAAGMMDDDDDFPAIKDLEELGMIKGIGQNMVENMRSGLSAAS
ncbi:kinesin-domain-containing protein [Tuber magnatum]|uniref:Kinesin-like protein KIF22 n=1 Tax=Tuber magnatum TaxID=42249 RepID=A0A317SMU6_9PEZI|nr:kinesin-domain-containing protein [Tuber magnatum]